jgi:PAS domain S-box-containing protein
VFVMASLFTISLSQSRSYADIKRHHSEEMFRLLVEGVKDYAIFMLSPDGYIVTWNAGAEAIKGYRSNEIIGKKYATFFTPDDVAAGIPQQILHQAAQSGRCTGEGWRVRKDGSRFWANYVLTALYDQDGKLRGFSKVTRDVTKARQAQLEIQQLNADLEQRVKERTEALEEVNQELEAFTYTVSHDLRAPLRAIQGFSNILIEDFANTLDEEGQDYLHRVVNASVRMDTLIQDLLTYSRLTRNDIPMQSVNLEQVVQAAVANLEIDESIIDVDSPLPVVKGHYSTLVQVMTNLLSNSVKFVAANMPPRIVITCDLQDKIARLCIIDNGIGIAPHHQEQIFRIFERLHGIEAYPGTGIGLAIVQKGIERMGGRVGLESNGTGTTFWFELPIIEGNSGDGQ